MLLKRQFPRKPRLAGSGLALLGALTLASLSPPLEAAGDKRFCGGAVVQTVPSDLANVVGDMTLEHISQQPASMLTCAMGYMLEKCGDHETAHMVFDKCIAAGYVGAMIWKALMYESGAGVPRDLTKSAELMRLAAHSPGAYSTLGKLHYASALYQGKGVEKNVEEAYKWFREAAAEGDPDAQEFLMTGYHTAYRDLEGKGVGTTPASFRPSDRETRIVHQKEAERPGTQGISPTRTPSAPPRAQSAPVPPPPASQEAAQPRPVEGLHLEAAPAPPPAPVPDYWLLALLAASIASGMWRQGRTTHPAVQ